MEVKLQVEVTCPFDGGLTGFGLQVATARFGELEVVERETLPVNPPPLVSVTVMLEPVAPLLKFTGVPTDTEKS